MRRRAGGARWIGEKQGIKRSTAVDGGGGIPIGGITDPADRHDSPLLVPTLEHASEPVGAARTSVHLDRAYDSDITRERLKDRGLISELAQKGKPAPLAATKRWMVERTNSWHNAHKELLWCTERQGRIIDFWVAFSEVIIIVRRLIREAWSRYRWEARLLADHDLLAQALRGKDCENRGYVPVDKVHDRPCDHSVQRPDRSRYLRDEALRAYVKR